MTTIIRTTHTLGRFRLKARQDNLRNHRTYWFDGYWWFTDNDDHLLEKWPLQSSNLAWLVLNDHENQISLITLKFLIKKMSHAHGFL